MDYHEIKNKLKDNLSKKRFKHCKRVSKHAKKIAKKFSYDKNKAKIAGLLHDCAKELSNEELISICKSHNLPLGNKDIKEAHYLHGIAGAFLAKDKYNIEDKEIFLAIANHAGRPDMSPIEKAVMLADVYDSFHRKNIDIGYIENYKSLDYAFLKILGPTLKYCVDNDIYMAERTQDAFDYILAEQLKEKYADRNFTFDIQVISDDGKENITYKNTELQEKMFKKAVDINRKYGLKLKTVGNIRDIGKLANKDKKTIRSASLSKLSKQDAEFLKDYGITTIIDLRTQEEIKREPDINIDSFNYYNCPLPVSNPELNYFRDRMLERKRQAFTNDEDIWYNVQYFASFDMIDMYAKILFDKDSIKQINKVLSIINKNKGGVLFHCTSGKDRTGIISIFLLYFYGLNFNDIRADYYTSSLYGLAETESYIVDMLLDGYGNKLISETKRILGVSIDSLPAIRNIVEQKYGSVDQYIKEEII